MVKVKEDLTNKKIGNWTVVCQADDYVNPNTGKRDACWLCECNCEKHTKKIFRQGRLRSSTPPRCCSYKAEIMSRRSKKYNIYDLSGEYGIGYTTKGEEFYFDLEDYDLIKDYCWWKDKDNYIRASVYNSEKSTSISLHRLIMRFPNATDIDHIHGNKTRNDNRKSNLRAVTKSQNAMNKILQSNNTSGITGVSWFAKTKQWRAYITVDSRFTHIGLFDNFEDAIRARKEAEEKYFGEFSYDNSINN